MRITVGKKRKGLEKNRLFYRSFPSSCFLTICCVGLCSTTFASSSKKFETSLLELSYSTKSESDCSLSQNITPQSESTSELELNKDTSQTFTLSPLERRRSSRLEQNQFQFTYLFRNQSELDLKMKIGKAKASYISSIPTTYKPQSSKTESFFKDSLLTPSSENIDSNLNHCDTSKLTCKTSEYLKQATLSLQDNPHQLDVSHPKKFDTSIRKKSFLSSEKILHKDIFPRKLIEFEQTLFTSREKSFESNLLESPTFESKHQIEVPLEPPVSENLVATNDPPQSKVELSTESPAPELLSDYLLTLSEKRAFRLKNDKHLFFNEPFHSDHDIALSYKLSEELNPNLPGDAEYENIDEDPKFDLSYEIVGITKEECLQLQFATGDATLVISNPLKILSDKSIRQLEHLFSFEEVENNLQSNVSIDPLYLEDAYNKTPVLANLLESTTTQAVFNTLFSKKSFFIRIDTPLTDIIQQPLLNILAHSFYPKDKIFLGKQSLTLAFNPLHFSDETMAFVEKTKASLDPERLSNEARLSHTLLAKKQPKALDNLEDLSKHKLSLVTISSGSTPEILQTFARVTLTSRFDLSEYEKIQTPEKPVTIHDTLDSLATNVLEQLFPCDHSSVNEVSVFKRAYIPSEEQSRRFIAFQKVFKPRLSKYNILLTLPYQAITKTPLDLAPTSVVAAPSLVAGKTPLLPSRFAFERLNKILRNTHENLKSLPNLEELNTATLSEEFTTDVEITPHQNGKGYLFAITLEPISKKLFPRASQNFLFFVDKSGGIQKSRFDVFKTAVSKSLKYLEDGDTFNIVTFDSKITRFSPESTFYSASSKHAAKHFIETHSQSIRYAQPNLYKILMKAHEMAKKSPLPTSVILLTNGKTLEDFNTDNKDLSRLIKLNNDDFTLYTTCASQGNNHVMLEILSKLNKGSLMHSQTFAAFPRKVATVVKKAGNLLAQSIHVTTTKSPCNIEFYPDPKIAKNLFSDRPYTIVGYSEKLCDFELILQGRLGKDFLNLKKEISLKEAVKGGKTLHKELAMYQAYDKYFEFLRCGNIANLDDAKTLLKPYNTRNYR